jgi:uncharacterized protein YbaR (Trm112 family)
MLTEEYLAVLRCPIDPKRETKLILDDTRLLCEGCKVQFKVREGFASLLPDEAKLPDACPSIEQLPCRRNARAARKAGRFEV